MPRINQFVNRIKNQGSRRAESVRVLMMGVERIFDAYDIGCDTYIFERGIVKHLAENPSVLIVRKSELRNRARGWVMTLSSGNHAVAAFPLLDGRFWKLSKIPQARRSDVLMRSVLCANVVGGTVELSQRELSTADLIEADDWLLSVAGLSMATVVIGERNQETISAYQHKGQEWRVKPLAWTEKEMMVALNASRRQIASSLRYYHSMRGVHFLSYSEFQRFSELAKSDPALFIAGLKELVSIYEGNVTSLTRMDKYRGHHEIEFFGIARGVAQDKLIPELERLMEAVMLGKIRQLGVIQRSQEICALFESLLTQPELADEKSPRFIESMYMHITGEVYSVVGDGSSQAFDDRRTALPGATFTKGKMVLHDGADNRTAVLLSNLCGLMSEDEVIEYVNVYELRTQTQSGVLGKGATREVVYKTNRCPLESSLIEKRISQRDRGYGSYVIARIGALRSVGVTLSDFYMLLRRPAKASVKEPYYYIRRRCEGETIESMPSSYFRNIEDSSTEDQEVVLALATLMGDAAAQNMAMKKYDAVTESPLFGIGKEIYEFEYDIIRERVVPKKVSTCSVRGSFGWPSLEYTDENLLKIGAFYMGHYAKALRDYQLKHSQVSLELMAERFFGGFEFRTHAMEWTLSMMRDRFEVFDPDVPQKFKFLEKWRFVMWALERQERRLPVLRKMFLSALNMV